MASCSRSKTEGARSARAKLGYLPGVNMLSALEPNGPSWRPLASPTWLYRFCANTAYDACNWLVPIHSPEMYCRACRHNRVIPDLTGPGNILAWQKLEAAKHRLLLHPAQAQPAPTLLRKAAA